MLEPLQLFLFLSRPACQPPFVLNSDTCQCQCPSNSFTCGGVKITADAEVVNRDGAVIPGLYAAGETTGLYYTLYVGATSVLRGLVFGRLAGRKIGAELGPKRSATPARGIT